VTRQLFHRHVVVVVVVFGVVDVGVAPVRLKAVLDNHFCRVLRVSASGVTFSRVYQDLAGVQGCLFDISLKKENNKRKIINQN